MHIPSFLRLPGFTGASPSPDVPDTGNAVPHRDAQGPSTSAASVPSPGKVPGGRLVRPGEIAAAQKLQAACAGHVAASVPTLLVDMVVAAISAKVTGGNLAAEMRSSAIGAGLELAAGLGASALAHGVAHAAGLNATSFVSHDAQSESEVLRRISLASGALGLGNSALAGIGYDVAGKAILHGHIANKDALESLINKVISTLVASGVIGVGARALYKRNDDFRNLVKGTVLSVIEEIRQRSGGNGATTAEISDDQRMDRMEAGLG